MSDTVTNNQPLSKTIQLQFTPRQQQIVGEIKQKLKQFTQPEIKAIIEDVYDTFIDAPVNDPNQTKLEL